MESDIIAQIKAVTDEIREQYIHSDVLSDSAASTVSGALGTIINVAEVLDSTPAEDLKKLGSMRLLVGLGD